MVIKMKFLAVFFLPLLLLSHAAIAESFNTSASDSGMVRLSIGKLTPIDFGTFADMFHFSGDRVYIGKWRCEHNSDDVSVGVYDRETLQQVGNVGIETCDDSFQDSIVSLVSDDESLYLSIQYRYAHEGRTNFVMIDKKSLKVTKKAFVEGGVGSLAFKEDELISCADVYGEGNDCSVFDPVSLKKTPAPTLRRLRTLGWLINENAIVEADVRAHMVTPKYYISMFWPYTNITAMPKDGGSEKRFTFEHTVYPRSFTPVMYRDALITSVRRGVFELSYMDLDTQTVTSFASLPQDRVVSIATDKEHIYLASGRDLYIYDIGGLRLQKEFIDFIPVSHSVLGADLNRIVRLIIDRGRLLVLTYKGEQSRLVTLDEILKPTVFVPPVVPSVP